MQIVIYTRQVKNRVIDPKEKAAFEAAIADLIRETIDPDYSDVPEAVCL